MTVHEWVRQNTGIVLRVPRGTVTGRVWEYQHPDGRWLRGKVEELQAQGLEWTHDTPKRLVDIRTEQEQYVELQISPGLEGQCLKALRNRNGRSVSGPVLVKRRKR